MRMLASHLFGTIDDVWNSGVLDSCEGAFDLLAKLRQGNDKAPKNARKLAEVCCDAWDKCVEEEERENFLTKKMEQSHDYWTSVTGLSKKSGSKEPKCRNTEKLSKKVEQRAVDTIINMFGETEKHSKTRAHLLPNSPACVFFWGMVCEAVSGINLDGCREDKKMFVRTEMATWLRRFKVNLFAFAAPHNSFYELLEDDQCVMIIPLLSLGQIAEWKEGVGYEVLFCCSRKAQKKVGVWSMDHNLNHIKWEGDGDLEKATSVLTAYVKALGDSLNQHWDSFFTKVTSDHHEFKPKRAISMQRRSSSKRIMDRSKCLI
jgi:hypothetical protein